MEAAAIFTSSLDCFLLTVFRISVVRIAKYYEHIAVSYAIGSTYNDHELEYITFAFVLPTHVSPFLPYVICQLLVFNER
jgi:hypothetical protein